uniref:Ovule protein n=1 Tax=Haemonchus placei TaxID=6290 RepID=A0A0N4VXQ2_HAEPC
LGISSLFKLNSCFTGDAGTSFSLPSGLDFNGLVIGNFSSFFPCLLSNVQPILKVLCTFWQSSPLHKNQSFRRCITLTPLPMVQSSFSGSCKRGKI